MAKRPYPRSGRREIVNYDDFYANRETYALVCVNRSVLDVARKLLASRGVWPTTYALDYDDSGYTPIGSAEIHLVDQLVSEFLGGTATMNCDDFLTQLTAIGQSILGLSTGTGCGCGSGGAPGASPPLSPVDVGLPGEHVGPPPDGFASWTEYETYKCDVAKWLIQQVDADLTWMLSADLVGITATGLAIALITPVPFDEVIILVGLIAAIIAQGAMASALTDMIAAIDDDFSEIMCAMYEAETATEAQTDLGTAIDTAVDGESSDPWAGLMKSVLKTMFGSHNLNKLFVRDNSLADSDWLPSGNCSGCAEECAEVSIDDGTLIDHSPPFITVQSVQLGSGPGEREQVTVRVNWDGAAYCDTDGRSADIDTLTGWVTHSEPTVPEFEIHDQAGADEYESSAQWSDGTCGARFFIRGDKDNTFTVKFDIGDNCAL